MKSILFDLDNTLYPEEMYVKSGFCAVSNYLSKKYNINSQDLFSKMMEIFNNQGRGKIFNLIIDDLKLNENVLNLVYIYRYHIPEIYLYPETLSLLKKLKNNYKLGLITDGRVFVQKRKVEALGIEKYFDVIIFTDILGVDFWKPSPEPYKLALNFLNSNASESCYVGDDSYKDFKGPHDLGMKTIQIKMEKELDYWKDKGYSHQDADYVIYNLNELNDILERY